MSKKDFKNRVWFDGACNPNPGKMGIGVYGDFDGQKVGISKLCGDGTCNQAEWLALLEAFELIKKMDSHGVLIMGDSSLVINQITGRWRCHHNGLRDLYRRGLDLRAELTGVSFKWVCREENIEADSLSKEALNESNIIVDWHIKDDCGFQLALKYM